MEESEREESVSGFEQRKIAWREKRSQDKREGKREERKRTR